MTTKSLLKVMAWLFLLAGVVGLAISAAVHLRGGPPADYGVPAIGGIFWIFCSAVAFFLRGRLP